MAKYKGFSVLEEYSKNIVVSDTDEIVDEEVAGCKYTYTIEKMKLKMLQPLKQRKTQRKAIMLLKQIPSCFSLFSTVFPVMPTAMVKSISVK